MPHSVLIYPACEKNAFSDQVRLLSGEHVWGGFQARECCCTQPVHRDFGSPWLLCHKSGKGLDYKKARVASWRKPKLWVVFIHCVNFFCIGISQRLVLLSIRHYDQVLMPQCSLCMVCPFCAKKAFTAQIRHLLSGEHV